LSLSGFQETSLGSSDAPFTNFGVSHYYGSTLLEANIIEKIVGAITIADVDKSMAMESKGWLKSKRLKPDVLIGIDQMRKFEIVDRKELPSGFWLSDSIIGPIISGIGFCKPSTRPPETVALVLSEPFNCPSEEERQQLRTMHAKRVRHYAPMTQRDYIALKKKMKKGGSNKEGPITAPRGSCSDSTGAEPPDNGPHGPGRIKQG
jgi:hypothetical protein